MHCRILFLHEVRCAFSFAPPKAGNSNAARIAMIAITTRSSIKVNAGGHRPGRVELGNLLLTTEKISGHLHPYAMGNQPISDTSICGLNQTTHPPRQMPG